MDATLQSKCDLFAENLRILKQTFAWDNSQIAVACSAGFTVRGELADPELLKECARILRKREGIFSDFRGHTKVFVICRMALSGVPEQYLEDLRAVYKTLRRGKFFGSEMYVLAATTILEHNGPANAEYDCERAKELLSRMRREHPLLTSESDMPFAAMLAVSGVPVDVLINDMEDCYRTLKGKFHGDALQSLSHVLSVSELPPAEKCGRVAAIFDCLREMKHRYSRGYALAPLGALAMLDLPPEEIAYEIAEVDTYLKGIRGCGNLLMGSDWRRMYSAMLVMNAYMPEEEGVSAGAAVSGVIAQVIAMEICMIIACTSSTHAASAAASSASN